MIHDSMQYLTEPHLVLIIIQVLLAWGALQGTLQTDLLLEPAQSYQDFRVESYIREFRNFSCSVEFEFQFTDCHQTEGVESSLGLRCG